MYDIYAVKADDVSAPVIFTNLQLAVERCNQLEDAGTPCELIHYCDAKILSRSFWKKRKEEK